MNIKKEDFEVFDIHSTNHGGAYKSLTGSRMYNDEMYQEALRKAKNGDLSIEQLERADMWYCLHKNHVNKLYHLADNSFPPKLTEDKNNPALWKAGHWKWYLDNYR